jgi:hypothetical protein
VGQKSDFLHFPGKATPTLRDRTAKLAKSSEPTVQKNSLRGCDPRVVNVWELLGETSGIQPEKKVQNDCTNEGTSSDADGVSYARPLKVTKAERLLKRGSYACALM